MGISEVIKTIRSKLLEYDPRILEIIQFGSSIHAPRYAHDLDLLVITPSPRKFDGYLDAATWPILNSM